MAVPLQASATVTEQRLWLGTGPGGPLPAVPAVDAAASDFGPAPLPGALLGNKGKGKGVDIVHAKAVFFPYSKGTSKGKLQLTTTQQAAYHWELPGNRLRAPDVSTSQFSVGIEDETNVGRMKLEFETFHVDEKDFIAGSVEFKAPCGDLVLAYKL